MSDPLVPPITRQLLDLFDGPLRDVRFPDADVERLSRAVEEVREVHEALVRAELAVAAAREALADKQLAVAKQTERTVAYARIYAADRPELLATIEALSTPAPRGRGRPRKHAPAAPPPLRTTGTTPAESPEPEAEDTAPSHAAE